MISFVIAMECEALSVIENMKDTVRERKAGFDIVQGTLCGESARVVTSGVGKVPAGAATLMEAMSGATAIVNIGVAGGLLSSMKPGDMFEANGAVQYDFDLCALDGRPMGTLNGHDSPILPVKTAGFCASCVVATGDRFNDDPGDHALITDTLGCGVRDMELGAIAQMCEKTDTRLYSLKCVSDVYGSGATTQQFEKNLKECIAALKSAVPDYFSRILAAL